MITIPTTLILGAGASYPYGFPLGSGLVQQILNISDDDKRQLTQIGFHEDDIKHFIHELRIAEPPSIDFFLEHRLEFVEIGRLRISQILIKCEVVDKLNSCDSNEHWYKYFTDKIASSFNQILENKVNIITFNYDRSLETYLYRTLQSRYGKEMVNVIESLKINHVHGKLGYLPWESGDSEKRSYSPDCSIEKLKIAADGIKIIFEADGNSPEFLAAKETIANSERIYFLGFGYHAESLQRLGFPSASKNKKVHGSALGFTTSEMIDIYKHRIGHIISVLDSQSSYTLYSALELLRRCDEQLDC